MNGLRTLACSAAILCALSAQDPPAPPSPAPPPRWPALTEAGRAEARLTLGRLAAVRDDATEAHEQKLVALGAGVAPLVLAALGAKSAAHPEALERVLDRVVTTGHAALLAPESGHASVAVRRYVVAQLARAHDPAHADRLAKAAEDPDAEVRLAGALGLTALGDFRAFDVVFDECRTEWRERADFVATVLAPARGEAATEQVYARMTRTDVETRITGLRLLRSLAPAEQARGLAVFLDADEHNVKKEAINALRAVVDGAAPLENLSVFQAIEMAKQWKARIQ